MADDYGDRNDRKKLRLCLPTLEGLSKDDLIQRLSENVIEYEDLEKRYYKLNDELRELSEKEEKARQLAADAGRRENVLVGRLAAKEQEMQDYANQVSELKATLVPSTSQIRSTLLDPAVNLMFDKMKQELTGTKSKLEEVHSDLSAWKFTPDSNTGKRLMAKCRLLYQENEELGKMITSGRLAKLESDLALQKNFSDELKKSQSELDEFLLELDDDVEGMQSTIFYLQQQLREAKETITKLQAEGDPMIAEKSSSEPNSVFGTCNNEDDDDLGAKLMNSDYMDVEVKREPVGNDSCTRMEEINSVDNSPATAIFDSQDAGLFITRTACFGTDGAINVSSTNHNAFHVKMEVDFSDVALTNHLETNSGLSDGRRVNGDSTTNNCAENGSHHDVLDKNDNRDPAPDSDVRCKQTSGESTLESSGLSVSCTMSETILTKYSLGIDHDSIDSGDDTSIRT